MGGMGIIGVGTVSEDVGGVRSGMEQEREKDGDEPDTEHK